MTRFRNTVAILLTSQGLVKPLVDVVESVNDHLETKATGFFSIPYGRVDIIRQTAHRGGKTVTVITGFVRISRRRRESSRNRCKRSAAQVERSKTDGSRVKAISVTLLPTFPSTRGFAQSSLEYNGDGGCRILNRASFRNDRWILLRHFSGRPAFNPNSPAPLDMSVASLVKLSPSKGGLIAFLLRTAVASFYAEDSRQTRWSRMLS